MTRMHMDEGRGFVGFLFFLVAIAAIVGFIVYFGKTIIDTREIDALVNTPGHTAICLSQTADVKFDKISNHNYVMIDNKPYYLNNLTMPPGGQNHFLLIVPNSSPLVKWRMISPMQRDQIARTYVVENNSCSRTP